MGEINNVLIIQWGCTYTNNNNFPIAFPNECFCFVQQIKTNASADLWTVSYNRTVTITGFTVYIDTYTQGHEYIAIGY